MKMRGSIQAHFSLIYDLDWARGDRHIVTASADGTARFMIILLRGRGRWGGGSAVIGLG